MNLALADLFLSALDTPGAAHTFQVFDDKKPRDDGLAHVFHGTLESCLKDLREWHEKGAGVYVTVNGTDGGGRRASNVNRLRALFIDYDRPDVPCRPWGLEPSITVESSPGKVHAYWLLSEGERLEEFRDAQRQLIDFYGSDPQINDLPRVLRLPGFLHRKGVPFLVTCRVLSRGRRTIAEVLDGHQKHSDVAAGVTSAVGTVRLGLSSVKGPAVPTSTVPVGARNNHLTSLAGSMRRRGMSEEAILAALLAEVRLFTDPPSTASDEEIAAIARSVGRYEPSARAVTTEDVAAAEAAGLPAPTRDLPLTESGNAERLVRRHGESIRFMARWKKWVAWDGARFSEDLAPHILQQMAIATVRGIDEEVLVMTTGDDDDRAKLRTWATKSESKQAREAMVALASNVEGVAILPERLDADPWLMNVANGTVDLRTGQLRAHRPSDLMTKMAGVEYVAGARSDLWMKFLSDVTRGDESMMAYLQRAVGYTLTGETREQCLFFLHGVGNVGNGSNGKSTFVDTIMAMLGDYGTPGAQTLLLEKKGETHPTDQAALFGRRLVACQELPKGRAWDESLVKTLTGDKYISARRMREDFWTFRPSHKFWITGNNKPNVRGTDDGIWRRMRLIPFTAVFEDEGKDTKMGERLLEELPGVLSWAIDGCLAWQKDGLGEPAAVKGATLAYRDEQDMTGQFLSEYCVRDADARVKRSDMRRAYEHWCEQTGTKPVAAKTLAEELRARGCVDVAMVRKGGPLWPWRSSGKTPNTGPERGWSSVRIKTEDESAATVGEKLN